jgi:hypothetical protein
MKGRPNQAGLFLLDQIRIVILNVVKHLRLTFDNVRVHHRRRKAAQWEMATASPSR